MYVIYVRYAYAVGGAVRLLTTPSKFKAMSLAALAAYSDSDDSETEEQEEVRAQVRNPALQSKEEVRKLVSVVAGRGKTSSVKIGLPVVKEDEVSLL